MKKLGIEHNGIRLYPAGNKIFVEVKGEKFFAEYPINMEDVSDDLLWGMMYTLFIGLETTPEPQQTVERDYPNTMLSFSGGADSYAAYNIIDCIPIYLNRVYSPDYGKSQQDIVKAVDAIVINNNMEMIRTLYKKSHGFSWGSGYVALLLPLADYLKAGHMALGTVFDDACFSGVNGVVTFNEISPTTHYLNIGKTGVSIAWPTIGLSEIITTEISRSAEYANLVSSCHFTNKKDCGNCVKCFRKLSKVKLTPAIIAKVEAWKKTPKMAPSMVHRLKQYFPEYKDVDTTLVQVLHADIMQRWNPPHICEQVTALGYDAVFDNTTCLKFTQQINKII